jgi:hypothetical protein
MPPASRAIQKTENAAGMALAARPGEELVRIVLGACHMAACTPAVLMPVAACLLVAAPFARAREPAIGIEYVAPADCPTLDEVVALVAARTAGRPSLPTGAGDPRFAIEIHAVAGGKVGRLERRGQHEVSEARRVRGRECREVVQALALTAALSLGPLSPSTDAAISRTARLRAAPARTWSSGVALAALALLPPAPMSEVALFAQIGRLRDGRGIHSPDLRLTLAHARNDVLRRSDRAAFALSRATLAACPLGSSALRLCATGEIGVLDGQGIEVANPASSRTLWAAVGALAVARWRIGRRFLAETYGAVSVPLRRTDFVFRIPRVPVASVAEVVASAGLALGFSIP